MAYLKSTNIDGDLSVVNNIILEGGLNSTDGSDYYYGNTVKVIAGNTDLNTVTEPGIYLINYDVTPTLTNCPVSSEDTIKLIVHRLNISVSNFIQILLTTVGIYYRYAWVSENVFKPWELLKGIDDTGWQYVTLNSIVVPYDNNQGYMPRYRKIGNLVQVKGTLSPSSNTNSFGSSGGAEVFTLPEGYRPSVVPITSVFQGTSTSFFAMSINTLGVATISRYRDENGYETPTTASWMPFHFEYFVG